MPVPRKYIPFKGQRIVILQDGGKTEAFRESPFERPWGLEHRNIDSFYCVRAGESFFLFRSLN